MHKNTLVLDEMPKLFWNLVSDNKVEEYFTQDNLLFSEDIECIILRTKSSITESHLKRFPNVKTIIRAGSGYDNIDVEATEKYQVVVQNTPEANVQSASEHTLNMIFALTKQLKLGNEMLVKNQWKKDLSPNLEISDLNVLIVGLGRIGSKVAEMLSYLGANIRYCDPYVDNPDFFKTSYTDGLKWCNLVTFHCPLYSKTHHMFSKETLSMLEQKIFIVNVARGGVVDIDAVRQGLETDKLFAGAIDVYENEPWQYEGWEKRDDLILSSHVGAHTKQAKDRLSKDCFNAWNAFCFNNNYMYPITIWK